MHGPVRVAQDAVAGSATLTIELPKSSAFRSFPTDLQVVIQ